MKRREFIALMGGAAATWPVAARAQQAAIPVVGVLGSASAALFDNQMRAFRNGLASIGFVEGRNVTIESRWAEGKYERLLELAADLVARKVSAIVTSGGTPSVLAAKKVTESIPIVFVMAGDPVREGIVSSLSRPGGNITGVSSLNREVEQKRVELLRELIPEAKRFSALINSSSPTADAQTRDMQDAARALGLELHILSPTTEQDFETVFPRVKQLQASFLVISSDAFFIGQSVTLARLAAFHGIPAIFQFRNFPAAGGLMSYGTGLADTYHQAGIYVGRILKGEHPRDLPVQQSTKIELVINLKAAKALGLTIPVTLLGRADEVIE